MVEIEVLASRAIDVFRCHSLDARQIVVRGVEAIERHRIGPDRREALDRILLEFRGAPLLQLRRRDEIRGNAVRDYPGQDRPGIRLDELRIARSRKDDGREAETRFGSGSSSKPASIALPCGTRP